MNKFFLATIMITGLSLTTSPGALAQNRMAFVDLNEVLNAMPEAKKADSMLREYTDALNANANDMQKDLNEKYNKFVADSAKMTIAVKDAQRRILKDKIQELSGMDQKIQSQVEAKRNELAIPIQKKAMDAIKAVAKENGYTHVFPKENLYVFPEADDIGGKVKKKMGIN